MAAGAALPAGAQVADRAAFVTRLGDDTLAVERMAFRQGSVEVEALLRSPSVTYHRYRLERDQEGGLARYVARVWAGVDDGGEPVREEFLTCPTEGPCTWRATTERGVQESEVRVDRGAVPFVDQLHWPFEAALRQRAEEGSFVGTLPMFRGSRAMEYRVVEVEGGGYGLRHPTRGVSRVEISPGGELLSLDGYGTTRALLVERVDEVDVGAMARRFAALGAMGELSGRGEREVQVDGARITVDWGVPRKRGREIFGHLVAYGEVWRTGANAATHITFDEDVVVGGSLEVPAGTYTLFTIPREDGATLFFNTRTGINGQSYRPEANLGSVEMRRESLDDVVEAFRIDVSDTSAGGTLSLLWDRTAYRVDFAVR
jgi:hypothetical protein